MRLVHSMPAETFAAVTKRVGGVIRYVPVLGGRFILAWRVEAQPATSPARVDRERGGLT